VSYRRKVEERFPFGQWQRQSYEAFLSAILSNDSVTFPCIYATKGFKANGHRYLFLRSDDMHDKENIRLLAAALRLYLSTNSASKLGPNTSLVVLFPIFRTSRSVKEYYDAYWDCLRELHQMDRKPWPSHIPVDMDTPLWRFCFAGEPLFSAALTPGHEKRRLGILLASVLFFNQIRSSIYCSRPISKSGILSRLSSVIWDGPTDSPGRSPDHAGQLRQNPRFTDVSSPHRRCLSPLTVSESSATG
jgi:FPC/CPF motif-containing protein YcgG